MPLLNVRLDPEDARKARELRSAGVRMSSLVRGAIRAEYDRRIGAGRGAQKPSTLILEILAALPDPPGMPARRLLTTDRRALQRHVRAKLSGKRT